MKSFFTKNKRLPQLEALEQRLTAAADIADTGERLLVLEDIRRQNEKIMKSLHSRSDALLGVGMFAGLAAFFALAPLGPFVALGALMGATGVGAAAARVPVYFFGKESEKLLYSINRETTGGIQKLTTDENPLTFAQSPRFDDVMKFFPDLKAKFILTAAKNSAGQQVAQNAGLSKGAEGMKLNL